MRIPDSLAALLEQGALDAVVRPLMSGKEAQVYLVEAGGVARVAKVYKEAMQRTFKQRVTYTEGRQVRNSRDRRAMAKGSKYGRAQDEQAWRCTEVEMIYKLSQAGVRVPEPYFFSDGVFVMELVSTAEGLPAPRLGELVFTPSQALQLYTQLMQQVLCMLAAGVVHGDLSSFNILLGSAGPVLIDFPQAIFAANNQSARQLLRRDVQNLQYFFRRFAPGQCQQPYAQEMWALFERGELTPHSVLTGVYHAPSGPTHTADVLASIAEARAEAQTPRRPPPPPPRPHAPQRHKPPKRR